MRLILPLSLLACGEQPPSASATHEALAQEKPVHPMRKSDPDSTEVSIEAPPDLGPTPIPPPTIIQAHWSDHESESAEDGMGSQIPSEYSVAIDIESSGWVGRALDPVLHIDERRFHQYTHPGPGIIRYIVADADWLVDATRVGIQYGDDALSWISIPLPISEAP